MSIAIATGLRLRPERTDDAAFAGALYREERRSEFALLAWPEPAVAAFLDSQFALQQAHAARVHPAADRWIVERQRKAIGRLYVDRSTPCWRLIDIGLLAREQGRGHGTLVLRWLLGEAGRAGAAVDLHVRHENPRAAALYRRLGFVDADSSAASHARLRWDPS
ncbi:MAG: acetyltransferase family [Sphingomonas bacterium]|uniref:GNAT family N-acetyltransferase n=1 Tax=Sphingomonas bacterium TaxID=1895847 RepID=UPI00262B57C3|nr:GNAT family N-acetyltransferase [Sphingomonas bacterium]MDB5696110.1 acetyltransferase family [Sphingomonas bacterium]